MSQQYSIANHTILPLILKILNPPSITYLIRDPSTNSLLLFNPPRIEESSKSTFKEHIGNIQEHFKCKLTHSFSNSPGEYKRFGNEQIVVPSSKNDLKPVVLGQISICFIEASGYLPSYSLIAATHISPTSTKFPVLFAGTLLRSCSIDYQAEVAANSYIRSLDKIKYFPNETYIFPSALPDQNDFLFSQSLVQNPLILKKLKIMKENPQFKDALIPTSVMQEKMINPWVGGSKYMQKIGISDPLKGFQVLRKMRRLWKAQI